MSGQRRLLFLTILFSFTWVAFASVNDKAWKAFQIYDYFKAKKLFYKSLSKSPVSGSYGLALIYYRKDNPFHNYDSAYKYVMKAAFSMRLLSSEKKKQLQRWNITDSSVYMLRDSIFEYGFKAIERRAERNVNKTDSLLEQYMEFQHLSGNYENAEKARDFFVFSRVRKSYKSELFQKYINDYPESNFLQDAFYFLEKSIYEESTSGKTPSEYADFIVRYPGNRFRIAAEDEIFYIHKKNRDKDGLYAFIRAYTSNEHYLEAWKLFFTLNVEKYTPEMLAEFVNKYQDFPLKNTILEEINLLNKPLIKIHSGEKIGFIDTSGVMVIEPVFDEAEDFNEGLAIAGAEDKYGYIDKNGKWVIAALYDEAEPFNDGVAIVKLNKKHLLIDRTGTVISDEFDEINPFNEGLAVVKKSGRYGAVNRLGNSVIPSEYDKLGDFKNAHAWFEKEGRYGIIDKSNFVTIRNEYDWVDNYSASIRAKKGNFYGVIGANGEEIIPFQFERIEVYNDRVFVVVKEGKYGIMDRSACYYFNPDFSFDSKWKAEDIVYGNIVRLYKNDEQTLAQLEGKLLADFDEYDEIYLPSEGMIRAFSDDYYSFYDLKMHPVFKGKFDEAEDFKNGHAIVVKKDRYMIIDKAGTVGFNEETAEIEETENGMYKVKKGGLYGLLGKDLKWIIAPEYSEIELINETYAELKKDGKRQLYNLIRNMVIWREP